MGSWIGGFLVVAAAGSAAAVAAWLLHDRIGDGIQEQISIRGRPIAGVVGMLFAVTAGLTLVAAWDDVDAARDTIAQEAGATVDLYWYAQSLEEPAAGNVENRLRDYTATVVENEWRLIRKDSRLSEQAWTTLDELRGELGKIEPATTGQSDRYADALTRAGNLVDARRERLEHAQAEIPGIVWRVLVVAGLLVVVVALVFGAPNRLVHAALAFAAAAVVTLVLLLVSEINHPFNGSGATDVTPFEDAQLAFDHIDTSP